MNSDSVKSAATPDADACVGTTATHADVPAQIHAHGGDVEAVSREFGIPAAALTDFSASINPAGAPASVLARLAREAADPRLLARYPDPTYAELRTALSRHLDVPPASLTIANGSAALFGAIVRAFAPDRCLLAVPAFGEQPRALESAGCAIEPFRLHASDDFLPNVDALCQIVETRKPALCLLTNPHNPSGALMSAADVLRIARAVERAGTRLLLDEAFIDYAAAESVARAATQSSSHLVVMRSLTKFYGMPALRVGYAVSTPDAAARIGAQLPHWPVTTLAASAAAEALADHGYARDSLAAVAVEREWLRAEIAAAGFHVSPSAGNFLLVRLPDADAGATSLDSATLRARLIREHHLIVRDCRSFDGMKDGRFIRVAVLARRDNIRLAQALRAASATKQRDQSDLADQPDQPIANHVANL
jgi:threonine-phosphate decarboxylase